MRVIRGGEVLNSSKTLGQEPLSRKDPCNQIPTPLHMTLLDVCDILYTSTRLAGPETANYII